jgi:DNA-binding response OmpR family regulator
MKDYNILIVDDEIGIIQTIINLLDSENPNYNFLQTCDPEQGLIIAEKRQPDLIITDWQMPTMSGIEFIKALKLNPACNEIPVVMLTGKMTSSEHLKTALDAGAIDFIRKPIDAIELTARIRSMLLLSTYYTETVDLKNRELVSIAMNITRNNEFNLKVMDEISLLRTEFGSRNRKLAEGLQRMEHQISMKIKGESWQQFETYFNNVHPRFFETLTTKYPDISPAELKLAAFLRLNFSTKEIASIIFLSPDSIKTSRTRLRKKLDLSPDDNLNTFLMSV